MGLLGLGWIGTALAHFADFCTVWDFGGCWLACVLRSSCLNLRRPGVVSGVIWLGLGFCCLDLRGLVLDVSGPSGRGRCFLDSIVPGLWEVSAVGGREGGRPVVCWGGLVTVWSAPGSRRTPLARPGASTILSSAVDSGVATGPRCPLSTVRGTFAWLGAVHLVKYIVRRRVLCPVLDERGKRHVSSLRCSRASCGCSRVQDAAATHQARSLSEVVDLSRSGVEV